MKAHSAWPAPRRPHPIAPLLPLLLLGAVFAADLRAADPVGVAGITEPFLDVTLSTSVPGILTGRPPP